MHAVANWFEELDTPAAACSKKGSCEAPTLRHITQSGRARWMFWMVCANCETPSGMNSSPITVPPSSFMRVRVHSAESWPKL